MATTINYVIRKTPRKDGTFAVNIRIIHNRQQRRLPTSIYLNRGQVSKDLNIIKDTRACETVTLRVMELRSRLMELTNTEYMSVDQVVAAITRPTMEAFRLDLFEFAEERMAGMEKKTAEGYKTSLSAVERFIGKRRIDINEITSAWVRQFRDFLENEPRVKGPSGTVYVKKGKGTRAISYYLGCLRHLHNLARLTYNDDDGGHIYIPRQPFANSVIPKQPSTEHRVLSIAQIRAIMSAPTSGPRDEMAKDVFLLSFALAGTNTIDIFGLKKSNLDGDLLTYNRAKTDSTRADKAKITLMVPQLAAKIIEKYRGKKGMLLNFWDKYTNAHEFNRATNIGLKKISKAAGLGDIPLTSYYARHSWATIARNVCKIDFDTVNAALNHVHQGKDRIGDIYIARDYSAIWAAQEAVMTEVLRDAPATVSINKAM